jgi:protein-tyrosine phosphatase
MTESHHRHLNFDFVRNFRDLGGYQTRNGRIVAWRKLFRSGELRHRTTDDLSLLQTETGLASVLDLRSDVEIKQESVELITGAGIRYHNVPFLTGGNDDNQEDELFSKFTSMGQFYVFLLEDKEFGNRLIEALELIAEPENHPLMFHCTLGKDRTGILSAIVLSVLGVEDEDIITDYTLTAQSMEAEINRFKNDPRTAGAVIDLPGYFWESSAKSMELFLSHIQREHSSAREYVESHGANDSLVPRLERALLA